MEIYSNSTRFALACNNSTKIIEPIQSRCAVLRFTRLSDAEILFRIRQVCERENVPYNMSGLEAIIFIADGDMRNALNSLQSTMSGFGYVNSENVFKVCDQPQPMKIKAALDKIQQGQMREAQSIIMGMWGAGYAATDIIQTLFKVTKAHEMSEAVKLEFIREIGFSHMRIAEGLNTQLQLLGCVARLCQLAVPGPS